MRSIIVREYLESLTESDELDFLFPTLLEVMDFTIISTPKQTKGLQQYGKDVVAVGVDPSDGIKKRFYFELKGGQDRHITTSNFPKDDGIRESIIEAKDRPFRDNSNANFNTLPIKIVLGHNGELKANVRETFDGFIEREFPSTKRHSKKTVFQRLGLRKPSALDYEFERWGIFELTQLFDKYLFGEYLLTNEEQVTRFKKVLVLLNNPQNDFRDLFKLIDALVGALDKDTTASSITRREKRIFETLSLVSYIIYSYSRDSSNLEPAKRALPYVILKTWGWIVKTSNQDNSSYLVFFDKILKIYINLLREYFEKILTIAVDKHGLSSIKGGRYDQIGYVIRTFDFLQYLIFYFSSLENELIERSDGFSKAQCDQILLEVVRNNVSYRPLLDNHSIPIALILNALARIDIIEAKAYLAKVVDNVIKAYRGSKRLPDGGNNLEVVMKYIIKGEKSVYYQDSTSLLFGMLAEYLALYEMEEEYQEFKVFVAETEVDLAVFVPFDDSQIKKYLPEVEGSLEERLFEAPVSSEGFQSQVKLEESLDQFALKTKEKQEFEYNYLTDGTGYPNLRMLAHVFYKTPLFPDEWRDNL